MALKKTETSGNAESSKDSLGAIELGRIATNEANHDYSSIYESLRGKADSPQNIGLDSETIQDLSGDPSVLTSKMTVENSEFDLPTLIPTDKLYWYNQDLLRRSFGDKKVYLFTQLPSQRSVIETSATAIENGSVIIVNSDNTSTDFSRALQDGLVNDMGLNVKRSALMDAYLNQYAGDVKFEGKGYKKAAPFFEVYRQMTESGQLPENSENGASIVDVIKDNEAETLWSIYQKPFEDISTTSPINAGYDRKGFLEVLGDPSVVKVVNKEDGQITTVALFVTSFDHAPWLNEDYYKQHYTEAYDSNNILIFTGIVSDENKRGSMYSLDLIKLLLQVGETRQTNSLITFECNEVSSNYLPKLVDFAINHSNLATVSGLDRPIAQSRFHTLSLVK